MKLSQYLNNGSKKFIDFVESRWFLGLVFGWFIFQATYMAITVSFGLPPDETHHFIFIRLFEENGWSPFLSDQEGYYGLGEAVNTPYFLYHYLLSIPYHLFSGSAYEIQILRFINIAFAVGSLYVTYCIGRELNVKPLVRNMSVFIMSSLLMFVFISSVINYDNLMNLFSLLCILLFVRLWKKFTTDDFFSIVLVVILGSMTKISFLPIAVACIGFLVVRYIKTPLIFFRWKSNMVSLRKCIVLMILIVLFLIPFCERYIGNIREYGSYTPACSKVLTDQQCSQNDIYNREKRLDQAPTPPIYLDRVEYARTWNRIMMDRVFGILAHKTLPAPVWSINVAQLLMGLSLVAAIRYAKRKDVLFFLVTAVSLAYIAVLVRNNHNTYLLRGVPDLAVQGRYAFAVLPALIVVALYYFYQLFSKIFLQALVTAVLILFFVASCFPVFVRGTTSVWRNGNAGVEDFIKTYK